MSTALTALMIVIFPLNVFLAIGNNGEISFSKNNENFFANSGSVEGIQEEKRGEVVMQPPVLFSSHYPIKKETATSLAIPNAHAALIMDVDTKEVLFENEGKKRRQIASLTKMMTAILVMEKITNLNEVVTIDEEAVYVEGTKIGCPRSGYCVGQRLKVGEKITAINLLKAMIINSANDAALALAKHISGSEEEFAKLMNKKAKDLGLNDSNFCTASGLEPEGRESECYSSAYDIGYIAAYSMKYDLIWEIMQIPSNTEITSVDGTCSHSIINTISSNQITNCLGGKTGFTPLAGRSLLIAASDPTGKHRVIAVLLDDPYRWQDIKIMVDWAFKSYEWR